MIRPHNPGHYTQTRLPRMRGDDPAATDTESIEQMFAPHARG